MRGDEQEKQWAALMRAGNAGDASAYRRLLMQVTPVLGAAARRGLARAGVAEPLPRTLCRKRCLLFISSGRLGMRTPPSAPGFAPLRAIK